MKPSPASVRFRRATAALTDLRTWIWTTAALAVVVFATLTWLHFSDETHRRNALKTVRDFREARIDLSQGFLHFALATDTDMPFDRAQGIALLQQALTSLGNSSAGSNLSRARIAELHGSIAEVRELLNQFAAPSGPTAAVATKLRIAIHRLDRLADVADVELRDGFWAAVEHNAVVFRGGMSAAAVLLIAMFGIILKVNASRETSVAELRRGQVELRRWADAFENAGVAIAISDPRTNTIEFANPAYAAMRGMTVAEVCGRHIAELYPPEEIDHVRRMVAVCDREGRVSFKSRYRHTDGSVFPIQIHITSVRNPDGGLRYRVSTPVDISDLERAQHQFAEAQKMEAIGQLTGGVAHDFNNMLTVISGTIEILAEGVADRPRLAAVARLIDQAAERGAELTRQLLAFARRQPLEPRDTDINELVAETAQLLRPTLGAQVQVETTLQRELWPVTIDPGQLSNALVNLAVNARDAMPTGGQLLLATRNIENCDFGPFGRDDLATGPYVVIEVTDTGTGMTDAVRDKVFEPFFTTKEAGKGTGLGLSMVYGFIRQSGGHVHIDTAEGRGTTIRLYLPRGFEAPARVAEVVTQMPRGSETILVVEDDDMVRNFVVAQLRNLGYRPLTAVDGASALAIVDAGTPFDLLFTDVVMPGMNGGELAEAVLQRRPGTPVLYTSGFTENAELDSALLAGGVHMLPKPYRKGDLARKLREVLGPDRTALAG
ncbi:PAS domain S-box protein [Xanthobacteraceae bacterium Astr-EGSB]|uniref:ATP-binding protein n=1 Tax=Astrobacterium formosum TaxID=3069710 RepID=UPI0027B38270|nr:PAS domain S-box protein [Xanthobacteraceae bacterium Astr-EGSB]